MQRKNTRTLFFKQFPNADVRPPYSNRFIDLDIVRVENALKIQRLIVGFKILNDLAPASFGSYIQHSRLGKAFAPSFKDFFFLQFNVYFTPTSLG